MIMFSTSLPAVVSAVRVTSPTIFCTPRLTHSTKVTSSGRTPSLEDRLAAISLS